MDFGYTDSERQFRREVRAFLESEWPPEVQRAGRASAEEAERFRRAATQKGWFSLSLPEEYGGLPAFSQMERYIVSDEASRIGAPLPPYLVSIIGPLIIKHGSDWMKNEALPKICAGEMDFVLGFTEPETGSDLANLSTRAVRDGDEYVINGAKMYGNPGPGDVMYLAVRTDPDAPLRKGISVLFVEYGREGFTVTSMPTLDGGSVGATFYDDVRVPADHLLGVENRGWDYVREALDLDHTSGIPYGHMPLMVENLIATSRSPSRAAATRSNATSSPARPRPPSRLAPGGCRRPPRRNDGGVGAEPPQMGGAGGSPLSAHPALWPLDASEPARTRARSPHPR